MVDHMRKQYASKGQNSRDILQLFGKVNLVLSLFSPTS